MQTNTKSKDRFKNLIKHKWLVMWLLLALIGLIGIGSYGAYTNQNSVKRVVSTQMDSGLSFSSNYLVQLGIEDSRNLFSKKIFYVSEQDNLTRLITVCNYPQNDPTSVNEKDINYKIVATIISANTVEGISTITKDSVVYTTKETETQTDEYGVETEVEKDVDHLLPVKDGQFEGYYLNVGDQKYYFSAETGMVTVTGQKLGKNILEADDIGLAVNGLYKDYIDVIIEVIPEDELSKEATNHYKLARIFHYMNSGEDNASWTGEFSDEYAKSNENVKKLDGFNYDIAGNGSGEVTLVWNSKYVYISPWFLEDIGTELGSDIEITNGDFEGEKKIVFRVGGISQADSYSIQFYRVQGADENEGYGLYAAGKYSVGITGGTQELPVAVPYVRFSFIPDEI